MNRSRSKPGRNDTRNRPLCHAVSGQFMGALRLQRAQIIFYFIAMAALALAAMFSAVRPK